MKTGIATLPLDTGKCPPWLFERMRRLANGITIAIIEEFGPEEFLKRLSDPVWFQSLACVMGWDYNSSGATPVTLAAIKDGIRGMESGLGIFICGGKGKTSKKTPDQIYDWGEFLHMPMERIDKLSYASKISAKVDSSLIQDGFQLYTHNLIFTKSGQWAVVQQGMSLEARKARRYHWLSLNKKDFIEEPHSGIISDWRGKPLNLTDSRSRANREISVGIVKEEPANFIKKMRLINEKYDLLLKNKRYENYTEMEMNDVEFHWHPVVNEKFDIKRLEKTIMAAKGSSPRNFENLLSLKGVGPKTIRALSLVAEIIYGAKPSYEDPARYTFAHGGKDGTPYFVNKPVYDKVLDIMERGIRRSGVSINDRQKALLRLNKITHNS